MSQKPALHFARVRKPVIGMVHLAPLPGAPLFAGSLDEVEHRALSDAESLLTGGVHALLIENFGDAPFYPRRVPPWTLTCMTRIALRIRDRFGCALGVNVLRNDALAALAIARAVGAAFIRVNVLCGARVADQGLLISEAHKLMRIRRWLEAADVQVFADVDVKHSTPLGTPQPVEQEVADAAERGRVDALIVSGSGTGRPADVAQLARVKQAAGSVPVLVGSGVTAANLPDLWPHADGFIVGTALKEDLTPAGRVSRECVEALMGVWKRLAADESAG